MKLLNRYQLTLDYLYKQLPMFQRVGAAALKKDLTNIRVLCKALGNPQHQFPSIHIAGTNGKGSTAHILSAVYQALGRKTAIYTSPHYKDFRERIKINGKFIGKQHIIDFVEQNKSLFEKIQPSFFEITVALAFDFFAQQKVDIAIIETGLGGRLDSTNIIQPILSIITNISFDHQQFLGDTLPQIAAEKAGIIKKYIPVVIGETQTTIEDVFLKKSEELNAPAYFADQHFSVVSIKENTTHTIFNILKNKKHLYNKVSVDLKGEYQAKNLVTAMQALDVLGVLSPKNEAAVRNGLENLKNLTQFVGRWHLLGTSPKIICDSAHNEVGLQLAMTALKKESFEQLHIVLGTVNDKDLDKILFLFPKNACYYFAKANIPRGLDAKILQREAKKHQLKGRAYVSIKNALRAAKRNAAKEDLIFVGGSIFTVAEVL